MTEIVFIGDEITATGYRLAGVRVLIVEHSTEADIFEKALSSARLLLITSMCAAKIPQDRLRKAQLRGDPLIAIVPDAAGLVAMPNLSDDVERALGIAL